MQFFFLFFFCHASFDRKQNPWQRQLQSRGSQVLAWVVSDVLSVHMPPCPTEWVDSAEPKLPGLWEEDGLSPRGKEPLSRSRLSHKAAEIRGLKVSNQLIKRKCLLPCLHKHKTLGECKTFCCLIISRCAD